MSAATAPASPQVSGGEISFDAGFIGASERRLYTVYRGARAPLRAAFVLCPPFFHEQFLSYRLLSLVAARLAERGIASLRFDYYGSADSWGEETDFTMAGALADTGFALDELARRVPGVPLRLFGARAGAWPAATVAAQRGLPLWLWQPLTDGAQWLRELEAQDAHERASRLRYPFLGARAKDADPQRLLAAYCPPALREEIARQQLVDLLGTRVRDVVVLDDEQRAPASYAREVIRLPHAATQWHAQIDMRATFVTPPVAACIEALALTLEPGATT